MNHITNLVTLICQIKFGISNRLQVEFLICRECFWCASCLNMSKLVSFPLFNKCLMCESVKSFDNIPICSNEGYRYTKDDKKGVELEFFLRNSREEDIQRQNEERGELLVK